MNFYKYTDLEFHQHSKDLQAQYSTYIDGKVKCLSMLIHAQRVFYKWLNVPVILAGFLAVKLGLPISHVDEIKKLQREQARAEEERLAKIAAMNAEKVKLTQVPTQNDCPAS